VIEPTARSYEMLISLFSDELGSVRDIYAMDATIETWDRLLESIRDSPWAPELRLGDQAVDLVPAWEIFAERSPEADTYTLRVTAGEGWLWCHFYSMEEVEFSFQASQIDSDFASQKIVEFMSWLSGVLRSDVKLTLEAPGGEHADPIVLVRAEDSHPQVFPP
jgi:hypothetical protein